MNYEHISLFPDNPWLSLAMGFAALLLFFFADRYVYSTRRTMTHKNESEY
ncbi:MAG: hypothetical protein R8G66_10145 [Cytophagales bacterium]|nr:hypothetical protein [Cytophagales bacterium]